MKVWSQFPRCNDESWRQLQYLLIVRFGAPEYLAYKLHMHLYPIYILDTN